MVVKTVATEGVKRHVPIIVHQHARMHVEKVVVENAQEDAPTNVVNGRVQVVVLVHVQTIVQFNVEVRALGIAEEHAKGLVKV